MKTVENWTIHAYADDELEAGERAEAERLIEASPEAQAELLAIRRQKEALKQAFAGVLDEPVPAHLLRAARTRPHQASHWPVWRAAAAGLMIFALGAGGGWLSSRQLGAEAKADFVDVAVGAHEVYSPESRHPVEVAAAESDHLQKWLSKRIGVSFKVPDLADQGYTLLGGRLLAEGGKPAALLMYEDHEKRRLTVYVAANPQGGSSGFEMKKEGQFVVCSWVEPDMVYAMVGSGPEEDLKQLAELAHDRFDS